MTQSGLISVIVPVYNAAPFLPECLDSLLAQDYPHVQLVIVDDGSDDGSAAIIDNYLAARPDRIKAVHKGHSGQASARNTGLDMADGSLIAFCDADDALAPYALSVLESAINKCDMAMAQLYEGHSFSQFPARTHIRFNTVDAAAALEATLYQKTLFHCSMGAKLFRRKFFDTVRFVDGLYYEDLEITPRLYAAMTEIAYTSAPVYFYRRNPHSTISAWSEKRFDAIRATDMVLENIRKHIPALEAAAVSRRFSACYNIFALARAHGEKERAMELWPAIAGLRREILFGKNIRAKNRLGALISYAGPTAAAFIANMLYRIKPSH